MPEHLLLAIALFFTALVVLILLLAGGSYRWRRRTAARVEAMEAHRASDDWRTIDVEAAITSLPAPVARYLSLALGEGPVQEIRAATLEQEGTFNLAEKGERWVPFRALHRVVTRCPNFVWDARIRMVPGLSVFVHDAYTAGQGALHGTLSGWRTIVSAEPSPELARGELLRYLAEAAWYPTALVPRSDGTGVQWAEVDEHSALATLHDSGITASLLFRFGDDGLVESVRCKDRGRIIDGISVPTPWEGQWADYERRHGLLVPTSGEVSWILPDGVQTYWRGRVVGLEFDSGESA